VRLIDVDGTQVGIIETREALERARQASLDLVEVAPQSRPPVCRIMDYGKWKYEQKKKEHKARAKRHGMEMKEVRIRTPKIGKHDLDIKVQRARGFLERGDRVQFTLRFRGREMVHQNLGREVLNSVKAALNEVAKVERNFRMEGRVLTMVLASTAKPRPAKRASPKQAPTKSAAAESQPESAAPAEPVPPPAEAPPESPAPAEPAPPPAEAPPESPAPAEPVPPPAEAPPESPAPAEPAG